MKILHFADAHIDTANYGRRDPQTGFPLRVLDFLNSLDEIIDYAIDEKVDCVLFAGDAYKNNNPSPTFQREWDKRILRLEESKILTYLLIGNHDIGGASKAHGMAEFTSFKTEYVHVVDDVQLIATPDFELLCLPWLPKSEIKQGPARLEKLIEKMNPDVPSIFIAHCTVGGAKYSSGQPTEFGNDFILPKNLLLESGFDYVALGHIHKNQDLNEGKHPSVVYPGSIERVDFGEAQDKKYFVVADISSGKTKLDWRELKNIRPFVNQQLELTSKENIIEQIKEDMPSSEMIRDGMVKLVLIYPWSWDSLIDELAIRELYKESFIFNLVRDAQREVKVRLPKAFVVGSSSEAELIDLYWKVSKTPADEIDDLNELAKEIMCGGDNG